MPASLPLSAAQRVRALWSRREAVAVPGTHDALGTLLVAQAGFEAVYLSGYCVAASHGLPDIGIVTESTMLAHARAMVEASELPVIADADTGYGSLVNIAQTVRDYERAGVAALHIEDQQSPKRCGAMAGKRLVGDADMAQRLQAAMAARRGDILIIGRTDAMTIDGLPETLRRVQAMAALGVDAVMVPSISTLAEAEALVRAVDVPVLHTVAETLRPLHTQAELAATGLGLALYPITFVQAMVQLQRDILQALRQDGSTAAFEPRMMPLNRISELLGAQRFAAFEDDVIAAAAGADRKG